MEAFAIPNQEASTIAQKLVNEFFCRFSMPEQLHSDQVRQFESILITKICKKLHIHKTRTTPYHPQGDGMVERFNCTSVNMLATSISDLNMTAGKSIYLKCVWHITHALISPQVKLLSF